MGTEICAEVDADKCNEVDKGVSAGLDEGKLNDVSIGICADLQWMGSPNEVNTVCLSGWR